jgi:hypothetical protein
VSCSREEGGEGGEGCTSGLSAVCCSVAMSAAYSATGDVCSPWLSSISVMDVSTAVICIRSPHPAPIIVRCLVVLQ